ncbi:MAG: SRPBCC family protein [Phycisphaeraceae bacterium]|nr:SRPBCC family protein [Phycisphaeraceae bacterium]
MPSTTDAGSHVRGHVYRFEAEVLLHHPIERVFAFFADAGNLERLTPALLRFSILTPLPIEMRVGALIDYRLRVRRIPIRWRTRIVAWEPPHRFVDVQEQGPYRLWRHEHTFEPQTDGSTLCRDRVDYAHFGGRIVNRCLVRPDIERIFAFREQALREAFV